METLLAESPLHTSSPFVSFPLNPDIKYNDAMYASKSSSEMDMHSELIQVRKQNTLLWKLVEKQRIVISQLKLHLKQANMKNSENPTSREVRSDIDQIQAVAINQLEADLTLDSETKLTSPLEKALAEASPPSPSPSLSPSPSPSPSPKAAFSISTGANASSITSCNSDFLIPELYSSPIHEKTSIPEKNNSHSLPASSSTTSLLLVTPPKLTSTVLVSQKIKEFNNLSENPSHTEMVSEKRTFKPLPSPPFPISFPSLPSLPDTEESRSLSPNTSQMLVPELLGANSQHASSKETKLTRKVRSKPLPNISIDTSETLKRIPYPSPEKKPIESHTSSTDEVSLEVSENSPMTPQKTAQFALETTPSAVEGLSTLNFNKDTENSELEDLFKEFSDPSPILMSPMLNVSPSTDESPEVKPLKKTVIPTRGNSLFFVPSSPAPPRSTPIPLNDNEQEKESSSSDLPEEHVEQENETSSLPDSKIVEILTEVAAVLPKETSSLQLPEKPTLAFLKKRPTSISAPRHTNSLPNRNSSLPAPLAASPNPLTTVHNKSASSPPSLPSSLPSLPSTQSPTSSSKNPPARKYPAVAPKQPFEMAPLKAPPEEKSTGIVRFFPEVYLHPPAPCNEDEQRTNLRIPSSYNATRDSLYLNHLPPRRQSFVHNVDEALFAELMQTDREQLQAKLLKMTPEEVAKIHSLLKDRTSK